MILCIWRGNISWLSGKLCGWLLEDLHFKQLYSETFYLEVCTFFLQFAIIYIHWVELVLCPNRHLDWTMPGARHTALPSTSGSNTYKERGQAWMLLCLPKDLVQHGCNGGHRKTKLQGLGLGSLCLFFLIFNSLWTNNS